jgi:hypothetical protein
VLVRLGQGDGESRLKRRGLGEPSRELGADFILLQLPRLLVGYFPTGFSAF